jgi:hypothetical protein
MHNVQEQGDQGLAALLRQLLLLLHRVIDLSEHESLEYVVLW